MPDLKALSRGTLIILGAGLLLLVDSFLAWQKATIDIAGITTISASENLWQSPVGVLIGLALVALLAWIGLRIANVDLRLNISERVVVGGLASLVFILIVLKNLIDDYSAWPSYVGIVLSAALVVGAWLYLQEREAAQADTARAEPPATPSSQSA